MDKIKGYLATHFFDIFGLEGTKKLGEELRRECPFLDLYIPLENEEINDKKNNDGDITALKIYEEDTKHLLASQVLIAYLDGVEIDAGVAGEVGLMSGHLETLEALGRELGFRYSPKMIIGIYSDMRRAGTGDNHMYKNMYILGAIEKHGVVVESVDQVIEALKLFYYNYPM